MKQKMKRAGMSLVFSMAFIMLVLTLGNENAYAAKLNKKTLYLAKGEKFRLQVLGSGKKVKWKSSNKAVAAVSKKGKVKGISFGKATVTAKVGGKKLKCKVYVEPATVKKARKLRTYLLSKGKYDKTLKAYCIKDAEELEEGNTNVKAMIGAYKKNNKFVFTWNLVSESPNEIKKVKITIDLISGTGTLKTGQALYEFTDEAPALCFDVPAQITTEFSPSGSGLTASKVNAYTEDSNFDPVPVTVTKPEEIKTYLAYASGNIHSAFLIWNTMLKEISSLKKAKISMKTIGFTKWE